MTHITDETIKAMIIMFPWLCLIAGMLFYGWHWYNVQRDRKELLDRSNLNAETYQEDGE